MGTRAKTNPSTATADRRGILARPLDSLLFLLPLILFDLAVVLFADAQGTTVDRSRVIAYQLLQIFFELFGTSATLLPGLAVVVILLATHVVSRQPWRIRKAVVVSMYAESILWALPLIAVNRFTQMAAVASPANSWMADVSLCIGAGIYEELMFRLVLISVLFIIAVDLLGFSRTATMAISVVLAAVVFSLHHHPPFGSEPFDAFRFTFRGLAGVYLGAIFILRGYGPAAGAHIAYNLLIIAMLG